MRIGDLLVPPPRRHSVESGSRSEDFFNRIGVAQRLDTGLFTHLPLLQLSLRKLQKLLRSRLERAGCSEVRLPSLQPLSLWEDSGRLDRLASTLFQIRDRRERALCLASTHEVAAAVTAAKLRASGVPLPIRIFQISTKFRDEECYLPGLIRTSEFTMQDLYTFDENQKAAEDTYHQIREVYVDLLDEIRLPFSVIRQSNMGSIGGLESEEFHVEAECGNETTLSTAERSRPSLEVAHIYQLGDMYTRPIDAKYGNVDAANRPAMMCSFGMGIERTICAFLEHRFREPPFVWSWALAPAHVMILGEDAIAAAAYGEADAAGYEAILDDRRLPLADKLAEVRAWGIPIYILSNKAGGFDIVSPQIGAETKCPANLMLEQLAAAVLAVRQSENGCRT